MFHSVEFKKIHDLIYLTKLCSDINPDFRNLLNLNLELINEAISMRYPYSEESSFEDAKDAIEQVKKYANAYKNAILRGINIDTEKKQITDWVMK